MAELSSSYLFDVAVEARTRLDKKREIATTKVVADEVNKHIQAINQILLLAAREGRFTIDYELRSVYSNKLLPSVDGQIRQMVTDYFKEAKFGVRLRDNGDLIITILPDNSGK